MLFLASSVQTLTVGLTAEKFCLLLLASRQGQVDVDAQLTAAEVFVEQFG